MISQLLSQYLNGFQEESSLTEMTNKLRNRLFWQHPNPVSSEIGQFWCSAPLSVESPPLRKTQTMRWRSTCVRISISRTRSDRGFTAEKFMTKAHVLWLCTNLNVFGWCSRKTRRFSGSSTCTRMWLWRARSQQTPNILWIECRASRLQSFTWNRFVMKEKKNLNNENTPKNKRQQSS